MHHRFDSSPLAVGKPPDCEAKFQGRNYFRRGAFGAAAGGRVMALSVYICENPMMIFWKTKAFLEDQQLIFPNASPLGGGDGVEFELLSS